ncbi:lantibiotic dehydratase C-terminal domain-containing protein [Flindersiella endophytica]
MSAHLYHFGDLDAFLERCIRPMVQELTTASLVRGHFFTRHWEGGPHLRLRLRPASDRLSEPIRYRIRSRAQGYFADRQSEAPTDPAEYGRLAAAVARAEGRKHYDQRLHAADSVEFPAYRPEYSTYGSDACITAVERHSTTSSEIAMNLIELGTPAQQRDAISLATLTLTLAVCEPNLSVAAKRLASEGGSENADPKLEAAYQSARNALVRQAYDLWTLAGAGPESDTDSGEDDILLAWLESIRGLRGTLEPLWLDGQCPPVPPTSPLSELASTMAADSRTVPLLLLECAHLFNNRIGLQVETEQRMAYLAARTLTDIANGA